MKIKFNQPKYILPLIAFPFVLGGGYLVQGSTGKGNKAAVIVPTQGVNDTIPDVASNIANKDLPTKFEAYQQALQNGQNLDSGSYQPIATDAQLQQQQIQARIDSIDRVYHISPTVSATPITPNHSTSNINSNATTNGEAAQDAFYQKLFAGADGNSSTGNASAATYNRQQATGDDSYSSNMKAFRDQMKVIDSMQQAANGTESNNSSADSRKDYMDNKGVHYQFTQDTDFQPETVETVGSRNIDGFNTLRNANANSGQIMAMIDQDVRATAGSRVRIRLLSDIYAGNTLISKGTYLYGFVTGFQTQRVNISVKYIQVKDKSIPVSLDLYDNDGYLGLYVPGSNFREFTKNIGSQSTQGMSSVMMTDGSNVMSNILSQIFSSTTTTAANLISKNRAQLKYNYLVYLRENQTKTQEKGKNNWQWTNDNGQ